MKTRVRITNKNTKSTKDFIFESDAGFNMNLAKHLLIAEGSFNPDTQVAELISE